MSLQALLNASLNDPKYQSPYNFSYQSLLDIIYSPKVARAFSLEAGSDHTTPHRFHDKLSLEIKDGLEDLLGVTTVRVGYGINNPIGRVPRFELMDSSNKYSDVNCAPFTLESLESFNIDISAEDGTSDRITQIISENRQLSGRSLVRQPKALVTKSEFQVRSTTTAILKSLPVVIIEDKRSNEKKDTKIKSDIQIKVFESREKAKAYFTLFEKESFKDRIKAQAAARTHINSGFRGGNYDKSRNTSLPTLKPEIKNRLIW